MPLTGAQKRALRARAHRLKPVVMVGQHGLHEGVIAETEIALDAHELIKLRIAGAERSDRDAAIAEIVRRTNAELVQRIGNVAVLFRINPKHRQVPLPKD